MLVAQGAYAGRKNISQALRSGSSSSRRRDGDGLGSTRRSHVEQALEFIALFENRLSLEDALLRYLREMDMSETMGAAVRTRVLVTIEHDTTPATAPVALRPADAEGAEALADDDEGWNASSRTSSCAA